MKQILAISLLALTLGGCVTTQTQTIDRSMVVLAPDSLYNCPVITKWPEPKTLTDLQVARTLVKLADDNRICKSSLNAIHKYYAAAKLRIEGKGKK